MGCATKQKNPSRGESRQFESGMCCLWGERKLPGVNGANEALYGFFLRLGFGVRMRTPMSNVILGLGLLC